MGGRGAKSKIAPGKNKLGLRRKVKNIERALTDTNPHFGEGIEWQLNCQRCVYAYEMNRRGYDVEAKPYIIDGRDNAAEHWQHIMKKQTWEKITSHDAINEMAKKMHDWGDGARAVVYVAWKSGSAHVFVAEQMGGQTRYVDPQIGCYVNIGEYVANAAEGRTEISRIDNLKPSPRIEQYVKKRERK